MTSSGEHMLEHWSACFPDCSPVAYSLKYLFPPRWVRFHSLPESKRYPESEKEFELLLKRHNAVLGNLTRTSPQVTLLTTEFSWENKPTVPPFQIEKAMYWRTVSENESFWHIYAESVTWVQGVFDTLVKRVAMDDLANVMICATDCEWLLHPYDGGMDVIVSSEQWRDRLRAEFSGWLSPHPAGL
jgi:hypothetical protein